MFRPNTMTDIILLDGSIGQEMINRTPEPPTGLWSTLAMQLHPDILARIHADYFAAGAIIATTNTYAIHRDRLKHADAESEFRALHEQATSIANRARDAHGSGYVAGSMGPLVASYRPDLCPPADRAADYYAEIAQIQADQVDLFLLETMSSIDQARGAVMGASVPNKPIWLAISVDDADGTLLRSGEPVSELMDGLVDLPVCAVLANCSMPEAVSSAMPLLPTSLPKGGYANGFIEIDEEIAKPYGTVADLAPRNDLPPRQYADYALRWADDGATILGGCCEIGPEHIRTLRDALDTEGHSRTTKIPL